MEVYDLHNLSPDNLLVRNLLVIGIELLLLTLVYSLAALLLWVLLRRVNSSNLKGLFRDSLATGIGSLRLVLRVGFMLSLLGLIGFNGWKTFAGIELRDYTIGLLKSIPEGFWSNLAVHCAIAFGLLLAARFLIRVLDRALTRLRAVALDYRGLRANDESIRVVFKRLCGIQATVIWLLVLYAVVRLFGLPDPVAGYVVIGLNVYLIISFGLLIVNAAAVIVDSLDALSHRYADARGLMAFYQRLRHLNPVLRRTLEYIIYAAVATLVLIQLEFIAEFARYGPGVIQGIGVIFLARVGVEVINLLIDRTYLHEGLEEARLQRNSTLFPIVKSVTTAGVYFLALVIVLRGLGFDPIPLLAGAGILGLVVGMGAQSLVNDLVSGFFIIFEYTFQVGDFIKVRNASGVVESIGLRTTCIRSPDGELYILQNGRLGDVVNYSRGYTNAVVNVGVSHQSDLQQVYSILRQLGREAEADLEEVVEPLEVAGIDDFSGPEIVIRTVTRVRPGCHKPVEREIRKRIAEKFAREGIVIPFENRFKLA